MPVTTKAQRSAEGGDTANSVKRRMCEFLSKTKKFAKSGDNFERSLMPTCGANSSQVPYLNDLRALWACSFHSTDLLR